MKRIPKPKPKQKHRGDPIPPVQVHRSLKREADRLKAELDEQLDEIDEAIRNGD